MKFSLTLILTCLIIFISSCSMSPRQDYIKPDMNLKIETSNKNKEIIIQSLLKDENIFSINFNNEEQQWIGTGRIEKSSTEIESLYKYT